MRDEDGAPLVQFQDDGNILLLKEVLIPSQANICWSTNTQDFVLLDNTGAIAAKVDGDSGDLILKGEAFPPNQSTLNLTGAAELAIQSSTDSANEAQIVIDTAGDLKTRGDLFVGADL